MEPALFIAGGFLCGSIPFSWILGKLRGADLREHGSGNPGATNLLRTCGKGIGVTGLLLDAFKGALPVYLVLHQGSSYSWLPAAVALASVLGHVFMPWFGFRGGKGVATALGALLVLAPLPVLCALGLFLLLVLLFRMISLGSVLGGISLPLMGFIFNEHVYTRVVLLILAASIILTHRSNIGRIVRGQERKLGEKK